MAFRRRSTPNLPAGSHVAVTWDIPDKFGGLTKAMLQRSCLIAQHAQVPVEVLTLALQPDLTTIRTDLVSRGLLVEGVTLVNMWEELTRYDDNRLCRAKFDGAETQQLSLPEGEPEVRLADGIAVARIHRGDGDITLVELLRADGSVLALQSWRSMGQRKPLTDLGDWAVRTEVYAHDGAFLGAWRGSWGLWDFWLRERSSGVTTHAIVDSAYVGDYFAHACLPGWTTMFVFHNNHLPPRRLPPFGPLGRWRRHAGEFIGGFDGAVFLTQQQRRDFETLRGVLDNVHVIPNPKTPPTSQPGVRREETRGIAMANLEPRKRLDHAVRAIAAAAKTAPGVSLHFYGHGPQHERLTTLIEELNAPAVLEGYTVSPESEFARASFMVLSSTNEGLPLVLAEAMAHGCIPIAYDIPYGPADVITHGVDGFLVSPGDHRDMARQISEFQKLAPRKKLKMRKAARRRAEAFDAPPVIAQWNTALLAAGARHRSGDAPSPSALADASHLAMEHRLLEVSPHIELVDAVWDGPTTVRLTLSCQITALGQQAPEGETSVALSAASLDTGERTVIPTNPAPELGRPNDEPGTTYVTAVLDASALDAGTGHVLLATIARDGLEATDTIMRIRHFRPWVSMPSASISRPVLDFVPDHGVDLVTAVPKVAAVLRTVGDVLSIDPVVLAGGTVESVEAVGFGKSPTIEATRDGDAWSITLAQDGRWKIQAVVGGRRRDIAFLPSSAELSTLAPHEPGIELTLTPRGYVRAARRPASPCLTAVSSDERQLTIAAPGVAGHPVLIANGEEHGKATAMEGRWVVDCADLAPGSYRLRWRGDRLRDVPASDEIQEFLPSRSADGAFRIERHDGRNYCRVVVI